MPQLICTFTLNTETNETSFITNMDIGMAMSVLQQIAISQAVEAAANKKEEGAKKAAEASKKKRGEKSGK